jgi:hypothetical protein
MQAQPLMMHPRASRPPSLQEVEKRLSRPVPALAPDLSLPPDIAARLAGSGGAGSQYGRQRGGGDSFAREVMQRVQVGCGLGGTRAHVPAT